MNQKFAIFESTFSFRKGGSAVGVRSVVVDSEVPAEIREIMKQKKDKKSK